MSDPITQPVKDPLEDISRPGTSPRRMTCRQERRRKERERIKRKRKREHFFSL
jgi:hypothetical protein